MLQEEQFLSENLLSFIKYYYNLENTMARARQKSYKNLEGKSASEQFFLYVAFHSAWTAIVNFLHND